MKDYLLLYIRKLKKNSSFVCNKRTIHIMSTIEPAHDFLETVKT